MILENPLLGAAAWTQEQAREHLDALLFHMRDLRAAIVHERTAGRAGSLYEALLCARLDAVSSEHCLLRAHLDGVRAALQELRELHGGGAA